MGIMDGVKVVELGVWVAGPAVTGVLADWGADVIKVEGLDSDPFRGALKDLADLSAAFDLDNRGKRALAIDWRSDAGAAIVGRLADGRTSSSPTCAPAASPWPAWITRRCALATRA